MVLRMSRPWRHPRTGTWYLRERIPRDTIEKARGRVVHFPPEAGGSKVTVGKEHVKASLRTKEVREAKDRHAAALAHLKRFWDTVRKGPQPLTHRQVTALAGETYRAFAKGFEDDPLSPQHWRQVAEANEAANQGGFGVAPLMILDSEKQRRAVAMELRFGKLADGVLAARGVVIDHDSRGRLLDALRDALNQAAEKLERNAKGDYRADPDAERFPKWEPKKDAKAGLGHRRRLSAVFEAWALEAAALGRSEKTVKEYRSLIQRFIAFLGHDDAAKVTQADIVGWKAKRLAEKIAPKTVKAGDLAALKSVFKWANENGLITTNPAKDVTQKLGRKRQERSKGFSDQEAGAVLKAALDYAAPPREHPKTAAARRWAPWLCAYTGARIGEILQLRRGDVSQRDGVLVMRITPEAGTVKDKKWREVPLHPHLAELGFAEFVEGSAEGYLFVNCRDANARGTIQGVKNRVSEFVRVVIHDKRVAPNHAWRHRFKTIGIEAGIAERVLDAICGNVPRTVGEAYGEVSLHAKIQAIGKLPRYTLA